MPNYKLEFDNYMEKIEEKDEDAMELFTQFNKKTIGERMADVTRLGYIKTFKKFLEFFEKPIKKVTVQDMENYKTAMGDKGSKFYVKSSTAHLRLMQMRRILQFISDKCSLNQNFNKVKLPKQTIKPIKPSDLLKNNEIQKLLKHATESRDSCLIALLIESGARISEILNLKVKDITVDTDCVRVEFKTGKTKEGEEQKRTVIIYEMQSYILDWLNFHPFKDSWLFITLQDSRCSKFGDQLDYMSAYAKLKKIFKRAGVRWRSFHKNRHTAVTKDVKNKKLSPQFINLKYGWRSGSKMIARYTHLTDDDSIEAQKQALGLENHREEELEEWILKISCPRCRMVNPKDAFTCSRCFYPLKEDERRDREDLKDEVTRLKEIIKEHEIIIKEDHAYLTSLKKKDKDGEDVPDQYVQLE